MPTNYEGGNSVAAARAQRLAAEVVAEEESPHAARQKARRKKAKKSVAKARADRTPAAGVKQSLNPDAAMVVNKPKDGGFFGSA